ncbi:hypothetical protein FOL47_000516 [Perkinsus chesapeaki]|uniref:CCHC-type domain-containing protein n=1 Tax=Perkinsus chesapeaki TaxID=330153 RepID=A0A7J6KVZ7_PERCH|nr:hypothetical protein FOL47_000516 [Perkinsus chesapeaki]
MTIARVTPVAAGTPANPDNRSPLREPPPVDPSQGRSLNIEDIRGRQELRRHDSNTSVEDSVFREVGGNGGENDVLDFEPPKTVPEDVQGSPHDIVIAGELIRHLFNQSKISKAIMNRIQHCLNKATAMLLDLQEENSGLKSRIVEILEVQIKNQEEMRKMRDSVTRSPPPSRAPNPVVSKSGSTYTRGTAVMNADDRTQDTSHTVLIGPKLNPQERGASISDDVYKDLVEKINEGCVKDEPIRLVGISRTKMGCVCRLPTAQEASKLKTAVQESGLFYKDAKRLNPEISLMLPRGRMDKPGSEDLHREIVDFNKDILGPNVGNIKIRRVTGPRVILEMPTDVYVLYRKSGSRIFCKGGSMEGRDYIYVRQCYNCGDVHNTAAPYCDPGKIQCTRCGGGDHSLRDCKNRMAKPEGFTCLVCKTKGHSCLSAECPALRKRIDARERMTDRGGLGPQRY